MSVEVVVFNDLHLADKPPAMRAPGYKQEGLDMLNELMTHAAEIEAAAVVSTGDLFHVKTPWKTSYRLASEVLDILRACTVPFYIVPGNHDCTERGLDSLPGQPLGMLERAGVVRYLNYDEPTRLPGSNVWLLGRPYDLARDSDPSYYAVTEGERHTMDGSHWRASKRWMFAHGSVVPNHEERPYPVVRLADINTDHIDLLASGHIHEDLGIHPLREGSGTFFVNVGSLGRVAKNDSNLTREVKAVVLSDQLPFVKVFRLDTAQPVEAIFLDGESAVELDNDSIDDFVRKLSDGLDIDEMDLLSLAHKWSGDPRVRDILTRLLEEAGA